MIEAYSENDWGIMLGKRNGLNQSILLREIEIIVNRISKVFANIGFEYQPFQFETESEQLKEDNWEGYTEVLTNQYLRHITICSPNDIVQILQAIGAGIEGESSTLIQYSFISNYWYHEELFNNDTILNMYKEVLLRYPIEGYILSPARNRQKFQIMKIHNFEGSIIPEDIWTKIDSISLEDFVGAAYFLP